MVISIDGAEADRQTNERGVSTSLSDGQREWRSHSGQDWDLLLFYIIHRYTGCGLYRHLCIHSKHCLTTQ